MLRILSREALTPKELSQELEVNISQASRTLKELEERKLVECTTPTSEKGRFYEITEKGWKVGRRLYRYLRENILQQILDELDRLEVPYAKNYPVEGEIETNRPELVTFRDGDPSLVLKIRSGKGFVDPRGVSYSYLKRELQRLAFQSHDLKEEDIEFCLLFYGVDRKTVEEKGKGKLEDYKEKGYFNYILFEDEIESFVELAERKAKIGS